MFPRWLSWLFLLLMGYLIYTGNQTPVPLERPAPAPLSAEKPAPNYPHLQQFTNANRWQRALNPAYVGEAKITDSTAGTGAAAQCGDEVRLLLRGTLTDGANFDAAHHEDAPLHITIGNAPYAILNTALLGMREGGVRSISAPPQLVYAEGAQKTRDDVQLRVELQAVTQPDTPADRLGLKAIIETEGEGAPARCGDNVTLAWTLWDAHGGATATATTWTIAPGKEALPRDLAHGLSGLRVGEVRTLLLPPAAAAELAASKALPQPLRTALRQTTILTITRQH